MNTPERAGRQADPALLDETRALAEAQGAKVTLHCADVSQRDAVQPWWTRRCNHWAASAQSLLLDGGMLTV